LEGDLDLDDLDLERCLRIFIRFAKSFVVDDFGWVVRPRELERRGMNKKCLVL
jgi:hypothetical protein